MISQSAETDLDSRYSVNTKKKEFFFFERTTVLSFLGTQYNAGVQMEHGTNLTLALSKFSLVPL